MVRREKTDSLSEQGWHSSHFWLLHQQTLPQEGPDTLLSLPSQHGYYHCKVTITLEVGFITYPETPKKKRQPLTSKLDKSKNPKNKTINRHVTFLAEVGL